MIDYVEIRRKADRELIGIIDTAKSIIWKSDYYGTGQFEIFVPSTPENIEMLAEENYVTRQNNSECGIIEHIEITEDSTEGKMIVASGRFVKSILDRRIIFSAVFSGSGNNYIWNCKASVLKGNMESAVRKVIYDNAINAIGERGEVGSYRNMPEIFWTDDDITNPKDDNGDPIKIITQDDNGTQSDAEKQVTYKNLLEYTDAVLKEYSCGARMWLDNDLLKFRYQVYKGEDRSIDSTKNEPIIFSKEFDNLISSNYTIDSAEYKTTALIGGEGEGAERKCAFVYSWISGLDRREVFVDASTIASTYRDANGEEQQYSLDVYRKQLETQGRQTIAELQKIETFDGEIDVTNSQFKYDRDFFLGDVVTIEDKDMGKYINARIVAVTEVQDDNGYQIEIEYGV